MDLPVLKMTTTNLSYCITGIIEPVPFANAILHQDAGLGGGRGLGPGSNV